MFRAKFKQAMHELRFAARLLRNFQAAQSGELDVNVADLARTLTDSLQHLQQLLLIAVAIGKNCSSRVCSRRLVVRKLCTLSASCPEESFSRARSVFRKLVRYVRVQSP